MRAQEQRSLPLPGAAILLPVQAQQYVISTHAGGTYSEQTPNEAARAHLIRVVRYCQPVLRSEGSDATAAEEAAEPL